MSTTTETCDMPTPWVVIKWENGEYLDGVIQHGSIKAADGDTVAYVSGPTAAYIVKCVNAHEALVTALKKAHHDLVTSSNLRATDLDVETFEAHTGNGVPRDQLEWMTDNSISIQMINAALKLAEG